MGVVVWLHFKVLFLSDVEEIVGVEVSKVNELRKAPLISRPVGWNADWG